VSVAKSVATITEREVFAAALCVDAVWRGDSSHLDGAKDRLLQDGWPRALGVLLVANKQLLGFLERGGHITQTPRSLIDLSASINVWLPPIFQIPGDAAIDAIQMVANPFSQLAQQHLSQHAEEVLLDWIFLFSGLVCHCAEMMNHDPYTVLMKTLSAVDGLP
jgi:hypothetical protein